MSKAATLAGRTEDLESVYRKEGPRLWRALVAYTGSVDVADEAVSETFAQALRRGTALRHPDRWVWRAAFRIAKGDLKKRRAALPLQDPGVVYNPEPAWELISALSQLPRTQRACLVLRYYGGYSSAEIARMVGSTPAAVRMQLTRGRRQLHGMLERGEIGA
jgi:RNA polymerase sigma-70 factor (ECF subfamily)